MKNIIKLLSIILILSISACKDDDEVIIPEFDLINAGIYDDSFYHDSLQNPIEIITEYTIDSIYKTGTTSFAINGLEFTLNIQILINTNTSSSTQIEFFNLEFTDEVDIISKSEKFTYSHNTKVEYYSVKMLNYGNTIDRDANWYSIENVNHSIRFWAENHTDNLGYGDYSPSSNSKYLAFRHFDKPGWIKIDMNDKYKPKVLEYALKK